MGSGNCQGCQCRNADQQNEVNCHENQEFHHIPNRISGTNISSSNYFVTKNQTEDLINEDSPALITTNNGNNIDMEINKDNLNILNENMLYKSKNNNKKNKNDEDESDSEGFCYGKNNENNDIIEKDNDCDYDNNEGNDECVEGEVKLSDKINDKIKDQINDKIKGKDNIEVLDNKDNKDNNDLVSNKVKVDIGGGVYLSRNYLSSSASEDINNFVIEGKLTEDGGLKSNKGNNKSKINDKNLEYSNSNYSNDLSNVNVNKIVAKGNEEINNDDVNNNNCYNDIVPENEYMIHNDNDNIKPDINIINTDTNQKDYINNLNDASNNLSPTKEIKNLNYDNNNFNSLNNCNNNLYPNNEKLNNLLNINPNNMKNNQNIIEKEDNLDKFENQNIHEQQNKNDNIEIQNNFNNSPLKMQDQKENNNISPSKLNNKNSQNSSPNKNTYLNNINKSNNKNNKNNIISSTTPNLQTPTLLINQKNNNNYNNNTNTNTNIYSKSSPNNLPTISNLTFGINPSTLTTEQQKLVAEAQKNLNQFSPPEKQEESKIKKKISKMKISKIIPEYFLKNLKLKNDEIIFHGELKKLINFEINAHKTRLYSTRFCILTLSYFKYYKSKEQFLTKMKPLCIVPLSQIVKISFAKIKKISSNDLHIVICNKLGITNKSELLSSIGRMDSCCDGEGYLNLPETNESLIIFSSDSEDLLYKWFVVLDFFLERNKVEQEEDSNNY